ncbi:MAG TPA: DUF6036 family nucleotidyltransferase [Gammaproteobacteria bacterium]|jgi:hypothetical protein|nr:DUF6036 family nucleotidyltransferase [Gammaproteobacteria bacterium]
MAFNLREIFIALDQAHARYVIVGGLAVILHGYLRGTHDLDLVIGLEPSNCAKGLQALESAGLRPRLSATMQDFADPVKRRDWHENRNMDVFPLWDPQNPLRSVDVFVHEPIGFDTLWRDSVTKEYDGLRVRVASIPHLIQMKSAVNRPQDRLDIENLRAIQEELEAGTKGSP